MISNLVRSRAGRLLALSVWCFVSWVLLTWTATVEVFAVGVVVSVSVAFALAPFGEVVGPWTLLNPRRLVAVLLLAGSSAWRVARANVDLARRIWSPSLPISPGMVIVPSRARGDAGLAGVGILTSLSVDNQIIDVDRSRHELLYHCVEVRPGDGEARYDGINGPVERLIARVQRPGQERPDA